MANGFYKAIVYSPHDEGRRFVDFVHINRRGGSLIKTATEREYSPEIMSLVKDLVPSSDKIFCLISALGASPSWPANSNSDAFNEDQLVPEDGTRDYGYKTFEYYARPYKHHINKPDSQAYGKVHNAVWNPRMKRVELITSVDRCSAPDIVRQVEDDEDVPVSMGCRVPFDVCSICGNRAKKIEEYCDDMKNRPNAILPDGRRVCVYNIRPKFFDISFVFVGADKTARVMAKVAGAANYVRFPSGVWAHKLGYYDKGAAIFKEIPGTAESAESALGKDTIDGLDAGAKALAKKECEIPAHVLKKAASAGLNSALATFTQAGVVLAPAEFQYLALNASNQAKTAEDLKSNRLVFDENDCDPSETSKIAAEFDFGVEYTNPVAAEAVATILEKRSGMFPFLAMRADPGAQAGVSQEPPVPTSASIIPLLGTLAALYAAYRDRVPMSELGLLDQLIARNPALLPLLAGITAGGVMGANSYLAKQSAPKLAFGPLARVLGIPALVYMYSGHQQRKRWQGEQLGPVDTLLADYPWAASIAGIGGASKLMKSAGLRNTVSESHSGTVSSCGRMLSDFKSTLDLLKLAAAWPSASQ